MNWKLAVVTIIVCCFAVVCVSQTPLPNPIPIVISGPGPWIDVKAYGAVGDGSTNDYTAIKNAIDACPANGCTIYFPSIASYKINTGLQIPSTKVGVKLVGECGGSGHPSVVGTDEACSRIGSGQPGIVLLTVGDGNPFQSGLVIQDLGFQDKMGGGAVAGAIHFKQVQDFTLINVHCRDITIGYCMQFDGTDTGMTNFTQFGVVINPTAINVLYPVQTNFQTSEINLCGGNLDCNGLGSSIGMDLGFTNHVKVGVGSYDTGGEWGVFGTHILDCDTGISMFNNSNMNYHGVIEQSGGSGTNGIVVDGDLNADKSILAGSISNVNNGIVLNGHAQHTRILADIAAGVGAPIVSNAVTLPTTLILTTKNYAGGGTAIGTQIPNDVTMPAETSPAAPVTGSRRLYADSGSNNDLSVKHSDNTVVDLEAPSKLLYYQKALPTISGTGSPVTVYSFSIPSIKAGAGIRARVFWQCAVCNLGPTKTFSWVFGGTTAAYDGYTNASNTVTYTEVRIFNDPTLQNQQTLFADPIIQNLAFLNKGIITTAGETTSLPVTLSFKFTAAVTESITPKGFIVEAIQ